MALDNINFEFEIGNHIFNGIDIKACIITKYIGESTDIIEIPEYIIDTPVRFVSEKFWSTIPNIKKLVLPKTLITPCYDNNIAFCIPNRNNISKLEDIYVEENNPWIHSSDGVLYISGPNKHDKNSDSTLYIYPPNKPNTEFQIPNWCSKIYGHAFEESNNLVSVNFNLVLEIGNYAFKNCTRLNKVKLNKVKSIGKFAFYQCTKIEELALLATESIDTGAFELCTGLRSISIGNDKLSYDFGELWQATSLYEIKIFGKACKRFKVIAGVLYSFTNKCISPVLCPFLNPNHEIILPSYVTSFSSKIFYKCGYVRKVKYNTKTFFYKKDIGEIVFSCSDYDQRTQYPVKNNGYLLYVPGPELDFLDLSDIDSIGEIAFKDVNSIRKIRAGYMLTNEQLKENLKHVQVGEIIDRPNTIIQRKLATPISNTETKGEPLPATKGKKVVVQKHNIIIVSQKFRCIREGHELEDVIIQVRLLHHGNISVVPVAGGYCSSCNRYYIYSEVFDNFLRGLKPGTVILQNRFKAPDGMYGEVYDVTTGLRTQSLLNKCGYSVSYNNGMSDDSRKELLHQIINSKLMTKQEIMSYLNYFINFNGKKLGNEYAKMMWEKDLLFLSKM